MKNLIYVVIAFFVFSSHSLVAQLNCNIQEANIYSTQFISFDTDCECSQGQNCAYVRIFLEDLSGQVFQCQGWGVEIDRTNYSIQDDHIDVFSADDCSEYEPLTVTESVYNQLIDFQSGGFIDVIICAGSVDPTINGIDISFNFSDYCFPVDCTNDITSPTCTIPDITINGDSNVGTVPITFTDYVIDDCGMVSFSDGNDLTNGEGVFNTENLPCETVTDFEVAFFDQSSNIVICNYTVTVECDDFENCLSTVDCRTNDISVYLDEDGDASISLDQVDNGTTATCPVILSLSQTDFTCEDFDEDLNSDWNLVGNRGFSMGSFTAFTRIVAAPNGDLYVSFREPQNSGLSPSSVMRFDGLAWSYVGTPGFTVTSTEAQELIVDQNGVPYLAYREPDLDDQTSVMMFNGTNWVYAGAQGFSGDNTLSPDLHVGNNNEIYLTFTQSSISSGVRVFEFDGVNWNAIGGPRVSSGLSFGGDLATNSSNDLFVVYRNDANAIRHTTVRMFDGSNWVNVGPELVSPGGSGFHDIAINDNDEIVISFADNTVGNKTSVMKYDGANWDYVGSPGFTLGLGYPNDIEIDSNGNIYVSVQDNIDNGRGGKVFTFNGSIWEEVGSPNITEGNANSPSLALGDNCDLFLTYGDIGAEGKATVKRYKYPGIEVDLIVTDEENNQHECSFKVTVLDSLLVCENTDPDCDDLSASLIPNPDFESSNCEPDSQAELFCSVGWEQATQATSDLFDVNAFPDLKPLNSNFWTHPAPPDGTRYVGMYRTPYSFIENSSLSQCSDNEDYVEYVGSELLSPIVQDETYTLNIKVGSPNNDDGFGGRIPDRLEADFVILGLPNNTEFPLVGCDCKEDDYEVIGTAAISLQAGQWSDITLSIDQPRSQEYSFIMFGLSCERAITGQINYLLVDDINLVPGELDCPSDCFAITADSPPCNSEIDTESTSTYTYDFSFTNNNEASFDKILVFETDDNFSLDAGGTLIDLGTTLAPGQSTELSWDITALNGFSGESIMYCFDIAPYNATDGVCCKESHCVELINCCPADIPPTKSAVMLDTEDCCYGFGYESCQEDYIVIADFEMLTEGLGFTASAVLDGFQVNTFSDRTFSLTMSGGGFMPEGNFDNVLQFCVDGMTSMSPEEQHFSVTWRALIADGTQVIGVDTCALACPIPEDECAELIDPEVYCDDFGVYHYRFRVRNINERGLAASIVVLGPEGTTIAEDFSHQTFPEFPNHDPLGPAYLEWLAETTEIDITLPNAVLGSSYEFKLSLHDYRNLNPEDDEYWCCYTPGNFTIDVDTPCGPPGLIVNPVDHVVFPNPATKEFKVLFTRPLEANAELYMTNTSGEFIEASSLEEGTTEHNINLQSLNAGLYFVSVIDDLGNKQYSRVVKR